MTQSTRAELVTLHRRQLDIIMNINTRLAVAKAFPGEAGLDELEEALLTEELQRAETRADSIMHDIRETDRTSQVAE